MKTVIVYKSQTGYTKRYAQWIAKAIGADCIPLAEAKKKDLDGYDAIVYGGWACAGGISGVKWFKERIPLWTGKRLAAFCVGASPIESPDIEPMLEHAFTASEHQRMRAFYFPGGLSYERMPLPSRLALKLFVRSLEKQKTRTEQEEAMVKMLALSYDISDERYIQPIVDYLQSP